MKIFSVVFLAVFLTSTSAFGVEPSTQDEKKKQVAASGKATTLRNLEKALQGINGWVAPMARIFVETWSRPIPRDYPPAQNNRTYFSDSECLDDRCGSSVGITIGKRW